MQESHSLDVYSIIQISPNITCVCFRDRQSFKTVCLPAFSICRPYPITLYFLLTTFVITRQYAIHRIPSNPLRFADLYLNLLEFSLIRWNLIIIVLLNTLESSEIYLNSVDFLWILLNVIDCLWILLISFELSWIYLNCSKSNWILHNYL